MMKLICTDMKIDTEPVSRELKTGDYCYFQLSTVSPVNGSFYKIPVQAFDDIPAKLKKIASIREEITGEKGCKGIIVEAVLTVTPYLREGNVVAGYKVLEISMDEGYRRTLKKENMPKKEENNVMDMAKMLDLNPFGM